MISYAIIFMPIAIECMRASQGFLAGPGLGSVAGAPLERGPAIRSCPGPNSSKILAGAPCRDEAKGDGQTIHERIPEEAFPWMAAMRAARLIAERAAEQTSGECVCRVRSQQERGDKSFSNDFIS